MEHKHCVCCKPEQILNLGQGITSFSVAPAGGFAGDCAGWAAGGFLGIHYPWAFNWRYGKVCRF